MICYGQTATRNSVQEWYETASRDAGKRTRQLKKLGIQAFSSGMGPQVTRAGLVKLTLVTIPGVALDEIPPVRLDKI